MLIIYLKFTIINSIHYFSCIFLNIKNPRRCKPTGNLMYSESGLILFLHLSLMLLNQSLLDVVRNKLIA